MEFSAGRQTVFPAGAGVNRLFSALALGLKSIPRRRGGKPLAGWIERRAGYVFPAGAGVNREKKAVLKELACIPRRRGGKPAQPRSR